MADVFAQVAVAFIGVLAVVRGWVLFKDLV